MTKRPDEPDAKAVRLTDEVIARREEQLEPLRREVELLEAIWDLGGQLLMFESRTDRIVIAWCNIYMAVKELGLEDTLWKSLEGIELLPATEDLLRHLAEDPENPAAAVKGLNPWADSRQAPRIRHELKDSLTGHALLALDIPGRLKRAQAKLEDREQGVPWAEEFDLRAVGMEGSEKPNYIPSFESSGTTSGARSATESTANAEEPSADVPPAGPDTSKWIDKKRLAYEECRALAPSTWVNENWARERRIPAPTFRSWAERRLKKDIEYRHHPGQPYEITREALLNMILEWKARG